jgi:hypothetical protein
VSRRALKYPADVQPSPLTKRREKNGRRIVPPPIEIAPKRLFFVVSRILDDVLEVIVQFDLARIAIEDPAVVVRGDDAAIQILERHEGERAERGGCVPSEMLRGPGNKIPTDLPGANLWIF